jgi:hypothetical protein
MSFANDDMIRTIEPGFLAPADGNYAPNGAQGVSPAVYFGGRGVNEEDTLGADATVGARHAVPVSGEIVDLGPNNERLEDLKPELVNALRELVCQYRQEGIVARRNEIRRIRQARLFWQGLQYTWWNPNDMNWHLPYENPSSNDRELEEMPRYQFVKNFYQGFGLSFIAVLSQDVPSVRFYPQSAQSLDDIGAARAASSVADLIERNNEVENLLSTIGYFLRADGKLGAYVRYVADGQRFGFHEEQLLAALEIPLGEDKYVCPKREKETAVTRDLWPVSREDHSGAASDSDQRSDLSRSASPDASDDRTSQTERRADPRFVTCEIGVSAAARGTPRAWRKKLG